jgi:hypothetical protein
MGKGKKACCCNSIQAFAFKLFPCFRRCGVGYRRKDLRVGRYLWFLKNTQAAAGRLLLFAAPSVSITFKRVFSFRLPAFFIAIAFFMRILFGAVG